MGSGIPGMVLMPIARETRREAQILDGFAEAMGHEYRRRVLFMLYSDGDTQLDVPDDLNTTGHDPEQFHLALVHIHLPKLESNGFITWDRADGTIQRGERFESLGPLLEVLEMYYDHVVPISDSGQRT